MPIKVDVHTNINDYELTIEKCSEIISALQETYQNLRKEMYNLFLGKRNLKKSIIFAVILLILFYLTKDMFFVYLMPVSVLLAMITSIISAEYITSQTRKQILGQLQHYKEKRDRLLHDQKIKV
ncbi:hypothetical protein [Candidatus Stoquefichus sp. SB1]|jgi:hypothetical protein|uniref:hypothetical protein n=1 Tax=Candidatus Stoquefichus sp. SB1 TaxID=1658109 RepID=UPI00067EBD7B|nr:hypothetical protein [Candidatus Stoquefichus sp. SB1]